MDYPYLLFDADNTLFDFRRSLEWSIEETLTELCGNFERIWYHKFVHVNDELTEALERGEITVQNLKQNRFSNFVERVGLSLDPEAVRQLYNEYLAKCTFLIEDAEEVVSQLSAKGHRMILITNGSRVVQRPRFSAAPITKHFEKIIISEEVGASKPNPKIFQFAMDALGNPPKDQVLMIGDNLKSDIQGGIDFGIDTCWFNPFDKPRGGVETQNEIKILDQLLDLA